MAKHGKTATDERRKRNFVVKRRHHGVAHRADKPKAKPKRVTADPNRPIPIGNRAVAHIMYNRETPERLFSPVLFERVQDEAVGQVATFSIRLFIRPDDFDDTCAICGAVNRADCSETCTAIYDCCDIFSSHISGRIILQYSLGYMRILHIGLVPHAATRGEYVFGLANTSIE